MPITLKTVKMLWGRAGNRCALCRMELVLEAVETADDRSVVGDMAHIIARSETFTRGDHSALLPDERDAYSNLILLCRIHHKQIDDQPVQYTVERLREIKTNHENWVRERLSPADLDQQRDDETYALYVQEFLDRIDIEHWTARGAWICSPSGPQMTMGYHDTLEEIGAWIIARIWPERYPDLEAAFMNFKNVLRDFLQTFSRHSEIERDNDWLHTQSFYKTEWVEQTEYDRRLRQYEDHVALANDLFLELTRALNYICDLVRMHLLPTFRVKEGAVLVERDCVGFDLHSERLRPEYRNDERTAIPYPGIDEFKQVRYSRDFYVHPDEDET